MKILIIGHTYTARVNRGKLYELAKYGDVKITVITPKIWPGDLLTEKSTGLNQGNIEILSLRAKYEGRGARYFYFPNIMISINRIKPDIIHVEEGAGAICYFQALVMKKLFVPKAKTLFFTWMNLRNRSRKPWTRFIERYNLRNSDYAIVGNEDGKQILLEKGFQKPIKALPQLGINPDIYCKIDTSSLNKRLGLNYFVIGFAGRLVKEKGLIILISALSKIQGEYKLLLIGRGDLKDEIIRLSRELNIIEKIIFIDAVSHEDIPKYLNCMDVLVLPSITIPIWKEQFGHILIEAMACEVPVIGSTCGEIPNVIGNAGLIFKEGDATNLKQKLEILMENKDLRDKLAKKGRERVLEKYTNKKVAEETYLIYHKLLQD